MLFEQLFGYFACLQAATEVMLNLTEVIFSSRETGAITLDPNKAESNRLKLKTTISSPIQLRERFLFKTEGVVGLSESEKRPMASENPQESKALIRSS
jgi:hypothetical protein